MYLEGGADVRRQKVLWFAFCLVCFRVLEVFMEMKDASRLELVAGSYHFC